MTQQQDQSELDDVDQGLYTQAQLTELMEQLIPFNAHLGVKVYHFTRGDVTLLLEPRSSFTGDPLRPALHGGLVATLADTAAGMAVFSLLRKPSTTSTINLKIDYLRPGKVDAPLYAKSKVIRKGSRVCFTQTSLYQRDSQQPIAISSATYSVVEEIDLPIKESLDEGSKEA